MAQSLSTALLVALGSCPPLESMRCVDFPAARWAQAHSLEQAAQLVAPQAVFLFVPDSLACTLEDILGLAGNPRIIVVDPLATTVGRQLFLDERTKRRSMELHENRNASKPPDPLRPSEGLFHLDHVNRVAIGG